MFGFFFAEGGPVTSFEDAAERADGKKFAKWHRGMLEHGVYLAPSQYEAGFTGLAHTEEVRSMFPCALDCLSHGLSNVMSHWTLASNWLPLLFGAGSTEL
jgi:glutamate-1-semialdehyde aminotransferase